MSRGRISLVVLLGVAALCSRDLLRGGCQAHGCAAPMSGGSTPLIATGLLLGAGVLAAAGSALRAANRERREFAALPAVIDPPLGVLLPGSPLPPITCLDVDEALAVCAGVWRPRIFVSRGLIQASGPAELRAVLLHEAHHAALRDPLRRAFRYAAVRVFFFLPVLGWWADRAAIQDELAADRAALRGSGPGPLARALLLTGGGLEHAAAGMGGAASLRIRSLAEGGVRLGAPSLAVCVGSAAGLLVLIVGLVCI